MSENLAYKQKYELCTNNGKWGLRNVKLELKNIKSELKKSKFE